MNETVKSYASLLEQLNNELAARFDQLPPDVRALLVQKGAISQRATHEMGALLTESAQHLALLDRLLDKLADWRDGFLLPLQEQSNGRKIEDPVNTEDLGRVIEQTSTFLREAGRQA